MLGSPLITIRWLKKMERNGVIANEDELESVEVFMRPDVGSPLITIRWLKKMDVQHAK